ncbi:DUF2628 domain-containing protein [Tumidithrix helvetica PCC 7403]|uniref:hypothetical protein n=1 Tax=Tumidithrix helvetica TaxID=3457545 RepID=UPI003C9FC6D1
MQIVSETQLKPPEADRGFSEIPTKISPTGILAGLGVKKLRGLLLLGLGYLLSPLCWWNDLIFNLPIAYGFGYVCGLFAPDLFFPSAIAGYWLSNLVGILLIQMGATDVVQKRSKERNFKIELRNGLISSTAYTLIVLGLIQFNIVDISAIDLSSFLPAAAL